MQEELIESLIKVEGDALKLEKEGKQETVSLREEYQQRMKLEEEERINKAHKKGTSMVKQAEDEALSYSERTEEELEKEIKLIKERYSKIRDNFLVKYKKKIIDLEGV